MTPRDRTRKSAGIPTRDQVSAGGVAFRTKNGMHEIAIVSVGAPRRWQLPKGIVEKDEQPEKTALREVREEAGIETELVAPIDVIEYWYVSGSGKHRVRFHKFVHFFLLVYRSGDVNLHDHEVHEARWVSVEEAIEMLAFENERKVVETAREMIATPDK